MAHNTDTIPFMFAEIYTGAPEPVFFDMWADDTSFTDAMDTFVERQIPGDDILDAVDEDEMDIDPETGGYSFFDPWDDDFFFDILNDDEIEEADALSSVGIDMMDYLLEAEEVVPTDLGAPVPTFMPPVDLPEPLPPMSDVVPVDLGAPIPGAPPTDLGMPVDITAGLPPTDLGGQPYVPTTDLGQFDPGTIYLEGGPMVDLLGFGSVPTENGDTSATQQIPGDTDATQQTLLDNVFASLLAGREPLAVVIGKIRADITEDELREWMDSTGWHDQVIGAGYDPDEFMRALNDAYRSDGIDTGIQTDLMQPKKTPAYFEQFSRVFDSLPGSQMIEAQRGKGDMFTDAETLFYLMTDWSYAIPGTAVSPSGNPLENMREGSGDMEGEETRFRDWLTNTYLKDPKDARFGEGFYSKVRELRDDMLEFGAKSRLALFEEDFDKNDMMNMHIFMGDDERSLSRLSKLVGMYNVDPGADTWLKSQVMNYYGSMMESWLLSGRDQYDFLETFVKDRPVMSVRDQWTKALPEEDPFL